jgi:hypothetical protein
MRCAWIRALTSMPPPAAKGTMSVIGCAGHSCAAAWPLAAITIAAAIIVLRMPFSLLAGDSRPAPTRSRPLRLHYRRSAAKLEFT